MMKKYLFFVTVALLFAGCGEDTDKVKKEDVSKKEKSFYNPNITIFDEK